MKTRISRPALWMMIVCILCISSSALAEDVPGKDVTWLTTWAEASAQAKKTGLPIMASFSSDTCNYCRLLEGEVFQTEGFKLWAPKNVILLSLEKHKYPPKDPAREAEFKMLADRYNAPKYRRIWGGKLVDGVPTVLFLSANGKEVLGKSGYTGQAGPGWMLMAEMTIAYATRDKKIWLAEDLMSGMRLGARGGRMLLLVNSTDAKASGQYTRQLEENKKFTTLAFSRLAVVHVRPDANEADLKYFESLQSRLKFSDDSRYIIIDPERADLYAQSPELESPAKVVEWLEETLPHIEWLTDYKQALAEAKKKNRPLMLSFTGSDWCGWCKRLDAEVFLKRDMAEWAASAVVTVQLDFPRHMELPNNLKEQNKKLRSRFHVQGFPTVVFLDPNEKELGTSGYMRGGPTPWIGKAKYIISGDALTNKTPPIIIPGDPATDPNFGKSPAESGKGSNPVCEPGDPSCDPAALPKGKSNNPVCVPGDPTCDPAAPKDKKDGN